VTHGTRILAVTGYIEAETRARVLEAGADGFLEKPFQLDALLSEVDRILRAEAE
jgi:DNA-binding response OmpR family regulator